MTTHTLQHTTRRAAIAAGCASLILLTLAACNDARRPVGLDLRGQVTAEVAAQASAYRAAGLPLHVAPVYVERVARGTGSRTKVEHGTFITRWTIQLDRDDATAHELMHAWAWQVLGDPDEGHQCAFWAHPLLWPPGAPRPPWLRGWL